MRRRRVFVQVNYNHHLVSAASMCSIEAREIGKTKVMDGMDDGKVTPTIGPFVEWWWGLASERSDVPVRRLCRT
jgi:hypothetical protein